MRERAMEHDWFMPIRRNALLARIQGQPRSAIDYLKVALMDPSVSIRELAQFELAKMGKNEHTEVYRNAIAEGDRVAIALLGLGETGAPDDLRLVLPFLRDKAVAIRAASVRAVGRLGGEKIINELVDSLQDCRKVAWEAKKGLQLHLDHIEATTLFSIAGAILADMCELPPSIC